MILSGWAKTKENTDLFNGESVHSVAIAIGRCNGKQVKFFVLERDKGSFKTETIVRIECHRILDNLSEDTSKAEIVRWLKNNVDPISLASLAESEKRSFLTKWHKSAQDLITIHFENPGYDYTTGVGDDVTIEMLSEYYVGRSFNVNLTGDLFCKCTSISINPVN